MKPSSSQSVQTVRTLFTILILWSLIEKASAVQVEPMGKALQAILKSSQVKRKQTQIDGHEVQAFYTQKGSAVETIAFIEKKIYEPNCTHTFAVGLDGKTGKVTQVRIIELSCPHAFPIKATSYLSQYKGKGPADVAKLDAKIQTIAKATGSCRLLTEAVKDSIKSFPKLKGQL